MAQDYNNPAFKKLLQKLQEESWQLELLISGFAIFGLVSAIAPLKVLIISAKHNDHTAIGITYTIIWISCYILIFSLLLHIILRGLWIGALGLRYISGDIDYEELNYSEKFTKYLKKKVGSFDKYIGTLENYCSVIFAVSFLLIFYVLAITFTLVIITFAIKYVIENESFQPYSQIIGIPLIIFLIIGTLMSFIDVLTLGWLKKKKWLSKLYFPFYWVFSFMTLSFLYRPIVYNMLDNKFGKRLSMVLVPLFIIVLIITSYTYRSSNYFQGNLKSTATISNSHNYEDLLTEEFDFAEHISIPSKVISNRYLKVFMLLHEDVENNVFNFNPDLKPEKDKRGYTSNIKFGEAHGARRNVDSLRKEYIKVLNKIYTIKIDSTNFESDFVVGSNIKEQRGFETYIGIKGLKEGKHVLKVLRENTKNKDTITIATIPFWYYPN